MTDEPKNLKLLTAYAFLGEQELKRREKYRDTFAKIEKNVTGMTDSEFEQLCRMCPEQEEMLKDMRRIRQ